MSCGRCGPKSFREPGGDNTYCGVVKKRAKMAIRSPFIKPDIIEGITEKMLAEYQREKISVNIFSKGVSPVPGLASIISPPTSYNPRQKQM